MTREEAKREIDSLDYYLQNHTGDYGEESHTAMMMAIKALEQEPCEDAISRQAVLDALNKTSGIRGDALKALYDLPSVTPQEPKTEWIPVGERLPEEMDNYMTTVDYGEYGLAVGQRYYYGKGLKWGKEDCVIAWQPLPEPYKGSENKE